jgi:hypothetical protein
VIVEIREGGGGRKKEEEEKKGKLKSQLVSSCYLWIRLVYK